MSYIGQSIPAFNNRVLVAGQGTFVGDVGLADAAHLAILRSAHGHARIRSIDVTCARAVPGVLVVLTGAEVGAAMNPIPWAANPADIGGNTIPIYALACERVRLVGEPVVAVVAENKFAAYAALAVIDVDYEPLPAVTDAVKALEPASPLVEPSWGSNGGLSAPARRETTFTRRSKDVRAMCAQTANPDLAPAWLAMRSVLLEPT